MQRTVITGTGCYIPTIVQNNQDFEKKIFYTQNFELIDPSSCIVEKFQQITGIEERRYISSDLKASDAGFFAAKNAIQSSGIDPETIDQIIVAQNFGDVLKDTIQTAAVPSLASIIKNKLGISNPGCIAYDILFGCPGWIQGLIQADAFFKAGIAKKALVIGTETLSRVIDVYDRDSMIFSDGAGATVLEYKNVDGDKEGFLGSAVESRTLNEVDYIGMGKSYCPNSEPSVRYIKMQGRKVYEFAMNYVPLAMKKCLEASNIKIDEVKKILIHQANEKMDDGILKRLYKLYNINHPPENIMPMSIQWLGNSSVATVPTLLDLVLNNKVKDHSIKKGDVLLFASVGAGMNINAVCYRY